MKTWNINFRLSNHDKVLQRTIDAQPILVARRLAVGEAIERVVARLEAIAPGERRPATTVDLRLVVVQPILQDDRRKPTQSTTAGEQRPTTQHKTMHEIDRHQNSNQSSTSDNDHVSQLSLHRVEQVTMRQSKSRCPPPLQYIWLRIDDSNMRQTVSARW